MDCLGYRVLVESDYPVREYLISNRDKLEFPELQIHEPSGNERYKMEYIDGYKKPIVTHSPFSICTTYPSQNLTQSNIVYLAKPLFERQFSLANMVTCHSACVEKGRESRSFIRRCWSG